MRNECTFIVHKLAAWKLCGLIFKPLSALKNIVVNIGEGGGGRDGIEYLDPVAVIFFSTPGKIF